MHTSKRSIIMSIRWPAIVIVMWAGQWLFLPLTYVQHEYFTAFLAPLIALSPDPDRSEGLKSIVSDCTNKYPRTPTTNTTATIKKFNLPWTLFVCLLIIIII